jgi:hypothetical protein
VLFLALYAGLILFGADFADIDDSIIALPIVGAGEDVASVWPHLGRFFPFGNREWFFVRQVTTSPLAHHGLVVVELMVLLAIVYRVLREFAPTARLLTLSVLLIAPSFVAVYAGLIYPERNLLLLIALLMLGVQAWSARPTKATLFGVLALTHVALYYKEPAFLIVSGLAVMRLGLAWFGEPRDRRSLRRLLGDNPLEVGMLGLSALFLALYAGLMLPHQSTRYASIDGERLSTIGTIILYLRSNPVFAVFTATAAARLVYLVRSSRRPDAFWDPLAFGALLYAGTFFWLGMRRPYYMAPVDLVGVLFTVRFCGAGLAAGRVTRWGTAAACVGVCVLALMQSWFAMVEKKNVIAGKSRLAAYVVERVRDLPRPVQLFLPHTHHFRLMEFASYLELKGLRVERWPADSVTPADVVLASPLEFSSGRCVFWIPYRCVQSAVPAPGGLVLVLPDDETGEMGGSLRPDDSPALAYQPSVGPTSLQGVLRRIHAVMDPLWRPMYLRDDWLWGYVVDDTREDMEAAGR